jgi:hypothetical protein
LIGFGVNPLLVIAALIVVVSDVGELLGPHAIAATSDITKRSSSSQLT